LPLSIAAHNFATNKTGKRSQMLNFFTCSICSGFSFAPQPIKLGRRLVSSILSGDKYCQIRYPV
jgi:hypothetical protein